MYPFLFGVPDRVFRRGNVPMTKEEVRVITLAKLCLQENMVLWDIGAGTGSVAVEAARLLRSGNVFAVEKDGEAFALLKENARAFELENLVPVFGEAPQVLETLPDPDRVFVGGSGGKLLEILEVAAARLPEEGVVVVNGITLETVAESVAVLEDLQFSCAVVLLGVSWVEQVGRRHLFRSANPVYVIQGKKGVKA